MVGGIPCLFFDPGRTLDAWRAAAHAFSVANARTQDTLLAQLVAEQGMPAKTRARVEHLRDRLAQHRARILALGAAAGIEAEAITLPAGQPMAAWTAYYHQIHRDWGWDDEPTGADEVRAATNSVLEVLADGGGAAGLGEMLVLGAGASRLPWEIHRRKAHRTLALDLNPVPLWVARRILAGETVPLFEFPIRPRTSTRVAVDRALACSPADRDRDAADRFGFAFADGLDAPVRPGAFDTVFTPWFIDQIPKDLAQMFPILHQYLPVGGTWLNHGPLIYEPTHTALVHRYCVDEVLAMTEAAGFRIERHTFRRMPYMVSPAGSQGRTEMVLSLRATKVAEPVALRTEGVARSDPDPCRPLPASALAPAPWLDDVNLPVPRFPGLDGYVAPHPMFAAIVAAIDGTRTIAEIGRGLAQHHGVPAGDATAGVRAALIEILRALAPPG